MVFVLDDINGRWYEKANLQSGYHANMVPSVLNGLVKRSKQRRLAVSNDSTICAGIDIGDRYCQIAVLDEDGDVSEQTRIRTTPKAFERYFKGKVPMRVAMEVGTHSPWISQLLNKMGHDALVGNACKLSLIYKNDQKSDDVFWHAFAVSIRSCCIRSIIKTKWRVRFGLSSVPGMC